MNRVCPVCSKPADANVGELSATKIGPLERPKYNLLRCSACDMVYLSPLPSQHDLDVIYKDSQFEYHTEETVGPIMEFMTDRARAFLAAVGSPARPAVLEIGAGPAWMARASRVVTQPAITVAQDVSEEMSQRCPWVDRYIVDSADCPEIDALGPYDVISLTHVIEHLNEPVAMLRRLRPVTRGGLFITAPHRPVKWDGSIESWRAYSYNHVPAHLQYFSERSMRLAAEASGLTLGHWDATAEDGQAFEAWLFPSTRAQAPSARAGPTLAVQLAKVALQESAHRFGTMIGSRKADIMKLWA